VLGCFVTCATCCLASLPLHRHGHCLAGSGLLSVIFLAVPATVRSHVGCVGDNSRPVCDGLRHRSRPSCRKRRPTSSRGKSALVQIIAGIASPTGALVLRAAGITAIISILKTLANDNYAKDQDADRAYWTIRLTFVLGATVTLFVLRTVEPGSGGKLGPLTHLVWSDYRFALYFLRNDASITFVAQWRFCRCALL
jgi:hypothetical protein